MINRNAFKNFLIYILLLLSFQTLSGLVFEDETVHAASTNYDSYNLVPQTSKGLIESGLDIRKRTVLDENGQILNSTSTSVQVNGTPSITGTRAYMLQYYNLDKILIVYDGAPSPSSLTKTNYTINGEPLDQKSSITYYEGNINPYASLQGGTNDINGFILIKLAKDTIDKTGLYEIKVENISNRTGQIMLPVTKNVTLIDNTAPTLQKVYLASKKCI